MKLNVVTTEQLMDFIESNLDVDSHYYGVTHKIKELTNFEVYFKDNKWLCREDIRPRLAIDDWEEFHKETVDDFFKKNDLCLEHFQNSLIQNILIKVPYYDMMIGQISALLGQESIDYVRLEQKQFQEGLEEALKEFTKPKLSVVDPPKEEK